MSEAIRQYALETLSDGAADCSPNVLGRYAHVPPIESDHAARFVTELPDGLSLEYLAVARASDTLVVSFHGATDRSKFTIPRFEWLRTVSKLPYSSLYFSDPMLGVHPELQLAWYTGFPGRPLYPFLARLARSIAHRLGSSRILYFGSSGGGFAALQTSSHDPGSTGISFNGQAAIGEYLIGGTLLGAQRAYIQHVAPELHPVGSRLEPGGKWAQPLGEQASLLARYQGLRRNRVVLVQNVHDAPHYNDHYLPLRRVLTDREPLLGFESFHYEDDPTHKPPSPGLLCEILDTVARSRTGAAS